MKELIKPDEENGKMTEASRYDDGKTEKWARVGDSIHFLGHFKMPIERK